MRSDLPIGQRAGTRLDHNHTEKIFQVRHGKQVYCGMLDRKQGVYQCGGELGKQVYWKLRTLGVGLTEWEQVCDRADWFEFIDLAKNVCYRISMAEAKTSGSNYKGEWGWRFGIPLVAFEVFDGPGLVSREPKPPEQEEPPEPQVSLF